MEKTVRSIEQDMKRRATANQKDMLQYADQYERSQKVGNSQRYTASSFDPRGSNGFFGNRNEAPIFRRSMQGGYNKQPGGYNYSRGNQFDYYS